MTVCEGNRRYWFLARHKGHGKILHIISAHSIGKARASMGRISEEYIFAQLTWSDIAKETGFVNISEGSESSFPMGALLYPWMGKTISVEVAD